MPNTQKTQDTQELVKFLVELDDTLAQLQKLKEEGLLEDHDGLPRGFYSEDPLFGSPLGTPFRPQDDPLNPISYPREDETKTFRELLDGMFNESKEPEPEPELEPEAKCAVEATPQFPPFNVSTTSDEKVVFIQVLLGGWSDDEISVHIDDDSTAKFIHIVGESKSIDSEDEIYLAEAFKKEDFDTKITISDEAYNGDVMVDMADGMLTITLKVAETVSKAKKVF